MFLKKSNIFYSDFFLLNKTEFHALLHRGQALNAYEAKMHLDNGTLNFGHGLDFESGKTKKAEKRPPTQIEIMAEMEREKQAKKEERRLAREAKKQARLEQEEFIRNGGNLKLSKKGKEEIGSGDGKLRSFSSPFRRLLSLVVYIYERRMRIRLPSFEHKKRRDILLTF